jgi:hypothetical protein
MGVLETWQEPDGTTHYLLGRPVECGDELELLLPGGTWLKGRYEWNGNPGDPPALWFDLGGPWEARTSPETYVPQGELRLHSLARLRWPGQGVAPGRIGRGDERQEPAAEGGVAALPSLEPS